MSVPPRTNPKAVRDVLGDDYGMRADGVTLPDLTPYIAIASVITDRVKTCALSRTPPVTLSATELELIERLIAAYQYTMSDPIYTSRSTSGVSGSFVRDPKEPNSYKKAAIEADYSGCVNAILNRLFASSAWLGKPLSEQIDWMQRN